VLALAPAASRASVSGWLQLRWSRGPRRPRYPVDDRMRVSGLGRHLEGSVCGLFETDHAVIERQADTMPPRRPSAIC
jgi:hypothetical protein